MTDCARLSLRPAAEKLPVSATATRIWSWSRVGLGCIIVSTLWMDHIENIPVYLVGRCPIYGGTIHSTGETRYVHSSRYLKPPRRCLALDPHRHRVRPEASRRRPVEHACRA